MEKKSICLVYNEDYPWDVRVEKLANSFIHDGYHVHIVCQNLACKPRIEEAENMTIHRLFSVGFSKSINKIINFSLWFNPLWLFLIFKVSFTKKCSLIVIRDLPLMVAGILVAKVLSIRSIFDMAECYPEMYSSIAIYEKQSWITRIIKSPKLALSLERICCQFSDLILVMIEESRDRLISIGVSSEKIILVSNTPTIIMNEKIEHQEEKLHIVYVGFITRLRGLDLLIRAIKSFVDRLDGGSNIQVDIIGKGGAKEDLIQLIKELGLTDYITVHGWLELDEIDAIYSRANVGALTYRVCAHWNHTIPNKIFDYMNQGLPVIATDVIPIKRILEETNSGLTASDNDIEGLADILVRFKDPLLRYSMGESGRRYIREKYNWLSDERRMLDAVSKLTLS